MISEPVSAGGLGAGPNPYNLLSAALGACTTMTIRLYAARKGWPLTHVQTAVRHTRANLSARDSFVLEIALDSTGRLRVPPKVIRNETVPVDEPRLQAEAGALAAIAACAPRGNLAFGGHTYRLEFPAAR